MAAADRRALRHGQRARPAGRWLGSDLVRKPAPVAQFAAAPAGYFDLAGNVWEWTSKEISDPDGKLGVLKGGSWRETNPANLRSAARMVDDPEASNSDIGFRCVTEAGAGG